MFCSKCGSEIVSGSSFCGKCGAAAHVDDGLKAQPALQPQIPPAQAIDPPAFNATQGGVPSAAAKGSVNWKVVIPVIAAAVVAVVLVAVFALPKILGSSSGVGVFGQGQDAVSLSSSAGQSSVTADDGTVIYSIRRPSLVEPLYGQAALSAAPALVDYVTIDFLSSGDSEDAAATSDNSTSVDESGGSQPSDGSQGSSDASDASDQQGEAQGDAQDGSDGQDGSQTGGEAQDGAVDGEASALSAVNEANSYTVEAGLANVANVDQFYFTDEQVQMLEANGFVVASGQDAEFFEGYEQNRYNYVPNFVTVDSMMHTYHLFYSNLQKDVEEGQLSSQLLTLSQNMLSKSTEQLAALTGTEWEDAARRNVGFFAVGAYLLDSNTQVPSEVADVVSQELSLIEQASGVVDSPLMGRSVDYSQYIVRGYYTESETLQRYFKAMMWYGNLSFNQNDESLDRSAALATLAMNSGEGQAVDSDWERIYTVTSFFAGASDDCGYYEYYPLLEKAYGEGLGLESLVGNDSAWEEYHALTAQMPAPRVNGVDTNSGNEADEETLEEQKAWRFMGQRFTLDSAIFTQLLPDEISENSQNESRNLPSALDVCAALGSDSAYEILQSEGETDYAGYTENMESLRSEIANSADSVWTGSLYSQWLYTINPLLEEHGEEYPQFMRSDQWTRKCLQSWLGSYTELKHDSVLYSKQAMVEAGGGGIYAADDRGYVEPESEVYTRLSALTQATSEGLDDFGLLSEGSKEDLALLQELADKLAAISDKELSGEALSDEDYELIRTYGASLEHFWTETEADGDESAKGMEHPAAVVTDIAANASTQEVLEIGTGTVSEVYVVFPIDGELHIASGFVFSFYEFSQPISERLTDDEWRGMLDIGFFTSSGTSAVPSLESWTSDFQTEN